MARTVLVTMASDATDAARAAKQLAFGDLILITSTGQLQWVGPNGAPQPLNPLSVALVPLTDASGGTVGATLAAITAGASYAQADLVAVKNAIATLNHQIVTFYNNLKTAGVSL